MAMARVGSILAYFPSVRLRLSRRWLWRMPSSGMLRRVVLFTTDVSEERITTIMVTGIDEQKLATAVFWWWRLYVPPKRRFLQEPRGVTSQKTAFFVLSFFCRNNRSIIKSLSCLCHRVSSLIVARQRVRKQRKQYACNNKLLDTLSSKPSVSRQNTM
jgi:hypothetical protein